MKKTFLFFLLISAAVLIFAQDDDTSEIIDSYYDEFKRELDDVNSKIRQLEGRISILEAEAELRQVNLGSGLSDQDSNKKPFNIVIIFIILAVIAVITAVAFGACIFLKNKPQETAGRYHEYGDKNPPSSGSKLSPDPGTQYHRRESDRLKPYGSFTSDTPKTDSSAEPPQRSAMNTRTAPGLSTQRQTASQTDLPKPQVDEISPLYSSREKRDKRHTGDQGDIFLNISKSVFERLALGEKVQLIFEKSGNRLSAKFVLVNNKHLYPNFHFYNETNELTRDNEKVLSMVYNLEGNRLPGLIKSCSPATVLTRNEGFYVVSSKGSLRIS